MKTPAYGGRLVVIAPDAPPVLGWELRMMAGDGFAQFQLCKTELEVFDASAACQGEARVKDWR